MNGNVVAQFCLGFMYDEGLGVVQDYAEAVQWYRNLILEFTVGKTLVVCSNHENREYDFCENVLELRK